MSNSLGTLTLDLIAKTGGFIGPLDKSARASKKYADDISANIKGISKASAILGVGAAAGFGLMVKSSLDAADALYKTSQKVGVSVENLSALKFSAGEAGVEFDALGSSLVKFNKGIDEANATGLGTAADAFSDLGIKLKNAKGELKGTNELFSDVADRFGRMADGATKTALATDLFGKAGAELIPLLNSGKKGLADSADEAKRLGQVLGTDASKAAEEFNDNLSRLQKSITGIANVAAQEAAPALAEMTGVFADPEVQKNIASFGAGLIGIATAAIKKFSELTGVITYLAESAAASVNGINSDDVVRLSDRLGELQARKAHPISAIFSSNLSTSDYFMSGDELDKQIAENQHKIEDYYKREEEKNKQHNAALAKSNEDAAKASNDAQITQAQIEANRKAREASELAVKAAKKAAEELASHFSDTRENLQKEIDLYGLSSKTAEINFEIQKGGLQGLSKARQEELLSLAAINDLNEINLELAKSQREVDLVGMGENGKLQSVQLEYDLKHGIIKLNDKMSEQDKQRLIDSKKLVEQKTLYDSVEEQIKNQQRTIDLYGKVTDAAKLEYDIKNGIYKVEDGIKSVQAQRLIANQKQIDALKEMKSLSELTADAAERIDEAFADAWKNIDKGFVGLRDGIVDGFKTMLAEMANQAITKPIVLSITQKLSGTATDSAAGAVAGSAGKGSSSGALAGIGAGGVYAAAALAVIAAVGIWNKSQDEKFVKMTAEYRQGTQSLGTILGEQNVKSQSIANLTDALAKTSSDTLDVNYQMYKTLIDIRTGITGVASGFAKTINVGKIGGSVTTGTSTIGQLDQGGFVAEKSAHLLSNLALTSFDKQVNQLVEGFIGGITKKVSSALYNSKSKLIDTGIGFTGTTLAEILKTGVIDAFTYADVQTQKKILGITVSTKLKRTTESVGDVLQGQFADVFSGAADVLDQAAGVFGIDFDKFVNKLVLPTQSLSLKDLSGDALTKEIESFFSSTLDNWAGVLVGGTEVLSKFQQIGEGAFETVIRLASEVGEFKSYAEKLGLNFKVLGLSAVDIVENLGKLAGGFDSLSDSLNNYAEKFFSDSEKFSTLQKSLGSAFQQLGAALPQTREQFRNLISGIDLSTEAGQAQFTGLIALTDATDKYLTALDRENQAKQDAAKAADDAAAKAKQDARDLVDKAFSKFSKAIQRDIDVAQNALNSSKQVADSLKGALQSMHLESTKNDILTRKAAQAQLITANAIAKAGGPLPGAGQLDEALGVLAQPSQDLYSSFEEYSRDFYATAQNIKELGDAAGVQVSMDEKNLNALQTALDFYQQQVDRLDDINAGVGSVRDAILELRSALNKAGLSVPVGPQVADSMPTLSTDSAAKLDAQNSKVSASFSKSQTENSESLFDLIAQLKEELSVSQFAIAKNTQNTVRILSRWDADGLPLERTEDEVAS